MKNIAKNIFLDFLSCPTLAWMYQNEKYHPPQPIGETLRTKTGTKIGKMAAGLYPAGIFLENQEISSLVAKTKDLILNPDVSAIFEGAFQKESLVTKADILLRNNDKWKMIEVKSSTSDDKEYIDDMAYTAMVMSLSGFEPSHISLMIVSKDFRPCMEKKKFFIEIDHTEEVLTRVEKFKTIWKDIQEILSNPAKPAPELKFVCKKCEFFKDCTGKDIDRHIFEIPRLSKSKFNSLKEKGINSIKDIPDDFELTENQARVVNSAKTGKTFIGKNLKKELRKIKWPAYYLDFEIVMAGIPLYPETAPYEQILTQYSIHKCSETGKVISHSEFLADPKEDCRRNFAENMIKDLEEEGSIIVYSSFEKTQISNLIKLFPDLSRKLSKIINRLIDLEKIIRTYYYHPDFNGSTSIKKVLPVLVPGMSYEGMDIAEGDSAMAYFAFMAMGEYNLEEEEKIKKDLLKYCKQDTLAMVKLHKNLAQLVSS